MRVVTRALSMASMVSGSPGPVPAGGENWALERRDASPPAKNAKLSAIATASIARRLIALASAAAGRNGHSRRKRDRTRYIASPKIITNSPHQTALPVRRKSQIQPAMVSSAGNGYSHILNGRRSADQRRRNSITPTACPMN